ncbi:MAG: diguanylate cyclase [Burkholderiales bacterium]|nr:diguanylate cyclase [Burkholderiales bacterium]
MGALELVTWSMALGAIAAAALARAIGFAWRPSLAQLRGVLYHVWVLLMVLVLSGVLQQTLRPEPAFFHVTQVLAGPTCVALCNLWIQRWLSAHQRDRVMAAALRLSALVLPLAGFAILALPAPQQLPAAAAVALLGCTLTLWITVRAALMGDRLAPVMAVGCAFTLPAIAGLYATAMDLADFGIAWQVAAALCTVLSNGLIGFVLWQRDRHEWQAHELDGRLSELDPVTRIPAGSEVVRKLLGAQRRRQRTRREGAVMAVMVFDVDRLAGQVGATGVNEMYIALAGRIQRQAGVVNTVGRYWDRCFIVLVETLHSPSWLRTLGLRLATSLRRPIEVKCMDGQRSEVRVDVGVGIVHLSPKQAEAEDILHEAQRMAEAARHMPSRAAILDAATGEGVPVEAANLGPRRTARQRTVTPV